MLCLRLASPAHTTRPPAPALCPAASSCALPSRHYLDFLLVCVVALCTLENDLLHAGYLALALAFFRSRIALRIRRNRQGGPGRRPRDAGPARGRTSRLAGCRRAGGRIGMSFGCCFLLGLTA